MPFRFIHLSDLHLRYEGQTSEAWIEREGLIQQIRKAVDAHGKHNIDCIIISGDIFNQGVLDSISETQSFFDKLRGICNKTGNIRDTKLIVIPGNHDLDRNVRCADTSLNKINKYHSRSEIISDVSNQIEKSGEFRLDNNSTEYDLLVNSAFDGFWKCCALIGADNKRPQKNDNASISTARINFDGGAGCAHIVLLNTALLAGQSIKGKAYRDRKKQLQEEHVNAKDGEDALKVLARLTRQEKTFEEYGELIIDEEVLGKHEIGNAHYHVDFGRMSFPQADLINLKRMQTPDTCDFTLFVGHHGFNYLGKASQDAIATAMKKCHSSLYLCGHAHKPMYDSIPISNATPPKNAEQFQAGAFFNDPSGYAVYGFNYGEINIQRDVFSSPGISTRIFVYYYFMQPSQEYQWFVEELPKKGTRLEIQYNNNKTYSGQTKIEQISQIGIESQECHNIGVNPSVDKSNKYFDEQKR